MVPRPIVIMASELRRSLRSRFLIGMTVVAPLVVCAIIVVSFSSGRQEPRTTRAALVEDTAKDGARAAQLWQGLSHPGVRDLLDVRPVPTEPAGRALLQSGDVDVVIVPGAPVQILHDPANQIAPVVVREIVRSLLERGIAAAAVVEQAQGRGLEPGSLPTLAARVASTPPPTLQLRDAGGRSVDETARLLAIVMLSQVIFFSFFTGGYAATSILRDAEIGVLVRLRTLPLPLPTLLFGKALAVAATVSLQVATLLIAATLLADLQLALGPLLLVSAALLVAAAGTGSFLISWVSTSRQAGPVLGGGLTVLGMFGGLFTPGALPASVQRVALWTPHGRALAAFTAVVDGAPLAEVLGQAAALTTLGVALFAVAVVRFYRRYR